MKSRILYTKPSITNLEVKYATDAVTNGWGEQCYAYINRFEDSFKKHLNINSEKIIFKIVTDDYFNNYKNLIKNLNCNKYIQIINHLKKIGSCFHTYWNILHRRFQQKIVFPLQWYLPNCCEALNLRRGLNRK